MKKGDKMVTIATIDQKNMRYIYTEVNKDDDYQKTWEDIHIELNRIEDENKQSNIHGTDLLVGVIDHKNMRYIYTGVNNDDDYQKIWEAMHVELNRIEDEDKLKG